MFSLIYNALLALYVLYSLPKFLWQLWTAGKYKESLKERLGWALPSITWRPEQKILWIHAVSMGETRAVISLYRLIKNRFPHLAIVISSTTQTGHAEAKRSMPDAHAHFFLPFDFSWIVKKYIKHLNPFSLILVESDLWYHLLSLAKQQNTHIFLVNGKISERSTKRFKKIPLFSHRLISLFDLFCVQSEIYRARFHSLGVPEDKLYISGNTKLDVVAKILSDREKHLFLEELGLNAKDPILVIGSSHDPEEEWLLSVLTAVWEQIPSLKVLIVPRHPERFSQVSHLLKERKIQSLLYSKRDEKRGGEKIILIDTMGLLNSCYQIAQIAIVAGSFVSHVGGHNIFEPVMHGVPVLFGPHVHNQPDLADYILQGNAGRQVTLEELPYALLDWLEYPQTLQNYALACATLSKQVTGASSRTLDKMLTATAFSP